MFLTFQINIILKTISRRYVLLKQQNHVKTVLKSVENLNRVNSRTFQTPIPNPPSNTLDLHKIIRILRKEMVNLTNYMLKILTSCKIK